MLPFKGISLKLESEAWNVNGDVKSDAPVSSESNIALLDLAEQQGYQVLKNFKEDSVAYDLLKNKLHIGKQSISWYSDSYYNPPIVTATNITIIPLRQTTDALGASLTYQAKTKSLELKDEGTGTTIALKAGSNQAVINGETVKWSFPVTVIDGVTYVPARDLAKALGAKISWEDLYDDVRVFTFEREL